MRVASRHCLWGIFLVDDLFWTPQLTEGGVTPGQLVEQTEQASKKHSSMTPVSLPG